MQKVKLLKKYKTSRVDDIVSVSNNEAHWLIENGYGLLVGYRTTGFFESPENKMMKPETRMDRKRRQRLEQSEEIKKRKPQVYKIK